MEYDYLIVGAGLYGSTCAYELTNLGYKVLVIDKRNHIAGNCYTKEQDNIHLHMYGPHIFHTSNTKVWNWVNQFAEFNNFSTRPVANYKGEIYSLPFNMWTFNKLWGVTTPEEARKKIKESSIDIKDPSNLEEQALKTVGKEVYEKLIKGYVQKQWRKPCNELPPSIIKRLPVRFTYDNNYYFDSYQGIPKGGYTNLFKNILKNIDVKTNIDYLQEKSTLDPLAKNIIYTGPIDKYFDYKYGRLEYKTTKFEFERKNINDFQGVFMVSYTDYETPFTRIIEHKHFEQTKSDNITWISKEYPVEFTEHTEPYYPVNDELNNTLYKKYKSIADQIPNIHFGGRLAEYKYYDMDKVILSALNFIKTIKPKI